MSLILITSSFSEDPEIRDLMPLEINGQLPPPPNQRSILFSQLYPPINQVWIRLFARHISALKKASDRLNPNQFFSRAVIKHIEFSHFCDLHADASALLNWENCPDDRMKELYTALKTLETGLRSLMRNFGYRSFHSALESREEQRKQEYKWFKREDKRRKKIERDWLVARGRKLPLQQASYEIVFSPPKNKDPMSSPVQPLPLPTTYSPAEATWKKEIVKVTDAARKALEEFKLDLSYFERKDLDRFCNVYLDGEDCAKKSSYDLKLSLQLDTDLKTLKQKITDLAANHNIAPNRSWLQLLSNVVGGWTNGELAIDEQRKKRSEKLAEQSGNIVVRHEDEKTN